MNASAVLWDSLSADSPSPGLQVVHGMAGPRSFLSRLACRCCVHVIDDSWSHGVLACVSVMAELRQLFAKLYGAAASAHHEHGRG
jgi:hypothetical protein